MKATIAAKDSVTADSVVRLVPPLIINAKEIDELVGILAQIS